MAGTIRPTTLRRPGGAGPPSAVPGVVLPPQSPSVSFSSSGPFDSTAAGGKKIMQPNRKQHDMDLKDIADRIASKEREIVNKKQQYASDAATNSERRTVLPDEIADANSRLKLASDALKTRNTEIDKKHDEVNQLRPRMTYRSESQIDETIRRLEHERTHRNFSLPEEQKIIREIDKLRRSKNELRNYNRIVGDRKAMETSLKELRDSRQACYNGMQRLISEEKSLKEGERRHRETVDMVGREIQDLVHRRNQIIRDFDTRLVEWDAYVAANRRWKHVVEQQQLRNTVRNTDGAPHTVVIRDPYASAKQVVGSLLAYLQPYVPPDDGTATALLAPPLDSSDIPLRSSTPPPSVSAAGDTPGYFLPKKYSDVTPPVRNGFIKAKKDKRKVKTIAHSAAVVAQFTSLDLLPPANTSEVPAAIESLKAKKLDLTKQTLAKLASLTPKTSPSEEELPPLPGPSLADVVLSALCDRRPEAAALPAITVTSVASAGVDEPDRETSTAVSTEKESFRSSPAAVQAPEDDSAVASGDEAVHQVDCQLVDVTSGVKLLHSYTMESVSEEDLSATTSVTASTAENSGSDEEKDEEGGEEEEDQITVLTPAVLGSLSKLPPLVPQLNRSGDGHLHPEILLAESLYPETPPIEEAFTKPVFPSAPAATLAMEKTAAVATTTEMAVE